MPTTTKLGCCACCVTVCDCFALDGDRYDCTCMSKVWTLVAADFDNDVLMGCTTCATFNGTHALNWTSACDWETSATGPCSGSPRWNFAYNSVTNDWEVVNAAGTTYAIDAADFDCHGINTLTKIANGNCSSVANSPPNTITIEPDEPDNCPCPTDLWCHECENCSADVVPRKWKTTISGVTTGHTVDGGDPCCFSSETTGILPDCSAIDGEYIMEACAHGGNICRISWNSPQKTIACGNSSGGDVTRSLELCCNNTGNNINMGFRATSDPSTCALDLARQFGCIWSKSDPWDCFGPNVLTASLCSCRCLNWPSSLTIEPA